MIAEANISPGGKIIRKHGSGEGVCLLLVKHDGKGVGLGDHIQSLPIIYELVKTRKVTVYANEFFRAIYERAGCEFHNETEIFFGISETLLPKYEDVYSMIEWSFDEHTSSRGESQKDHVTLFGEQFGIERPQTFDYVAALGAKRDETFRELDMVVYAPQSSYLWRNLPREEQIYNLLKKEYGVMWLGIPALKERVNIDDFETLVDIVYNAKAVFTVDNGIMHMACALGVPMFGVFGGTDEKVLCEPYELYGSGRRKYFRASPKLNECTSPCWWQSSKGWRVEGKCEDCADCMLDIDKTDLLNSFSDFLHIRSN